MRAPFLIRNLFIVFNQFYICLNSLYINDPVLSLFDKKNVSSFNSSGIQ